MSHVTFVSFMSPSNDNVTWQESLVTRVSLLHRGMQDHINDISEQQGKPRLIIPWSGMEEKRSCTWVSNYPCFYMSMYIIWDPGFQNSKENRGGFWCEFSPLTDAHTSTHHSEISSQHGLRIWTLFWHLNCFAVKHSKLMLVLLDLVTFMYYV